MSNVTAYIGRDYGNAEHTTRHVVNVTAERLMTNGIDGATFAECVGMWQGDVENSIRVDLLDCSVIDAHAALYAVCVDLMQWEIVYTIDGSTNVTIKNDPTAARATCAA